VLGFPESWSWDEEPTFGGVVNGDFSIFFAKAARGISGLGWP